MKSTEAREVFAFIKAGTAQNYVDDDMVQVWINALGPLHAEAATKTVITGLKEWTRFPTWAQFLEIYKTEKRKIDLERQHREEAAKPKAIIPQYKTPEWVFVWWWARRSRKPRCLVSFPQQEGYVDPLTMMSTADYDALYEEWVAAGSPTEDVQQAMVSRTFEQSPVDITLETLKATNE
jgi:hypothetical protein